MARRARGRTPRDSRPASRAKSASPRPRTRAACATRWASRCPRACPTPSWSRLRTPSRTARVALRAHARAVPRGRRRPAASALGEAAIARRPRRALARRGRVARGRVPARRLAGASGAARTCSRPCAAARSPRLRQRGRAGRARGARPPPRSTGRASPPALRPRRGPDAPPRRHRAAPGRGRPRLGPRARHPARAPSRLSARGPRHALRRRRGRRGSASGRLGRARRPLALYLADDLPLLLRAGGETARRATSTTACASTSHGAGASFFAELHEAVGRRPRPARARRALGPRVGRRGHERHAGGAARLPCARGPRGPTGAVAVGAFRSRRQAPPSAAGRWSLLAAAGATPPTPTRRTMALAEQLLARHGVLTRDAVGAEEVPGGFERGLSGAQGPRGGGPCAPRLLRGRPRRLAVRPSGRSRAAARPARGRAADGSAQAVVLAATDPANPYGAALPWPKVESARPDAGGGRPRRARGRAARGLAQARASASCRRSCPRTSRRARAVARALAAALARWAARTGPLGARLGPPTSARPLAESPLAPFLAEAGFVRSGPGFRMASAAPSGPDTLARDTAVLEADMPEPGDE